MRPQHSLTAGMLTAIMFLSILAVANPASGAGGKADKAEKSEKMSKAGKADKQVSTCAKSSLVLRDACLIDIGVNYRESSAVCLNFTNAATRTDCFADAAEAKVETASECRDVFEARQDLCEELGGGAYDPPFGSAFAANFVNPLDIGASVAPNPYLPLIPGSQRKYAGGNEVITVTVTRKTKLIDGITCLVVNDVVKVAGAIVEDTDDWFAQDVAGNVWYCGESVRDFETFSGDAPAEAELVAIDGSWKAGRDGAQAGIVMPANPQRGDFVRLELTWDEAEDAFEVLDVAATATTRAASCNHDCLLTRDFTPLSPEAQENKYYAPGIGLIIEVDMTTGERVELVEITP